MRRAARGRRAREVVWTLGLALALAPFVPARVLAQSYRGWTSTSVQLVELRPLGLDSVPRADVVTDAQGRFLYQGLEVSCVSKGRPVALAPTSSTLWSNRKASRPRKASFCGSRRPRARLLPPKTSARTDPKS